MRASVAGPHEKVLRLNQDPAKFGTFAEVGAGQEVVGRFFRAGHAANTVAKSISAYDMAVSDALYGPAGRHVSRNRLSAMLDREYETLQERLSATRGDTTSFFVFADTVATHTRSRGGKGHGWLGIRFQSQPRSAPSDVLIHVRLLDPVTVREQEALGAMGVNLIYGAFYQHEEPEVLIQTLMDGLSRVTIEVDMIRFAGPAFPSVDNRLMSLQLVEQKLTDAAMFTADGEVVEPAEILFDRPVLIERGSFRPVTNVARKMLLQAEQQLSRNGGPQKDNLVVLMEMTLNNLLTERVIDHRDFLARADILGSLGATVMISNFTTFHRVTSYLRSYTQERIGIVMGAATLREVMDEKYYEDLEGGILEALGRLFHGPVALLVYPMVSDGQLIATVDDVQVPPKLRHLFAHLLANGFIQGLSGDPGDSTLLLPGDVLKKMRANDPEWERFVPAKGVALVKKHGLFGYAHAAQRSATSENNRGGNHGS